MIYLLSMVIVGFLFGYVIVGPFNRGYTAKQWAGVMALCGTVYGALLLVALTLVAPLANPSTPPNPGGFLLALGFTTVYALAATVGVYIQQRRKGL